jgi:hypothetical protein
MRQALWSAGAAPADIDYLNAHGTSTGMNDRSESAAIKAVFGADVQRLSVSSTKSTMGHLIAAAGAVEVALCALAIRDGMMPINANLREVDPDCDLNFVRDTPAAWIVSETLHFVGLSMIVGVLLLINLRTLGVIQTVPFGALDRLLPWAVIGFGINAITGMLFFAAAYGQYVKGYAWYCKLGFIVAAGFNTLFFFFDKGWATEPGVPARPLSRVVAFSALFFWVGVMYWGSMLPFLGSAF